jgi:hypothetical protein
MGSSVAPVELDLFFVFNRLARRRNLSPNHITQIHQEDCVRIQYSSFLLCLRQSGGLLHGDHWIKLTGEVISQFHSAIRVNLGIGGLNICSQHIHAFYIANSDASFYQTLGLK